MARGPKPSAEKREAIITAALAAFALKGAEASTTREIAAAAGTTERTLFKHFGSKDALVQAAIETVSLELMRDRVFARVRDPQPFTRDSFVAWHAEFLRDRVATGEGAPDNYRILFSELLRDRGFAERYGARWLELVLAPLVGHLAQLQAAGEIGRAQSPVALASAFFSLNLGYLLTRFALAPGFGWAAERDIAAITGMFIAACGAPDRSTA